MLSRKCPGVDSIRGIVPERPPCHSIKEL